MTEITAIPGRCEDGVIEVETIFRTQAGELSRAEGFPPHKDRFARLGLDVAALLAPPAGEAPSGHRMNGYEVSG